VAAQLREHWVVGRLTLEDLEERLAGVLAATDQAQLSATLAGLPAPALASLPQPAPASPSSASAVASLVLGVVGLSLLFVSFGLLSFLTLPISATGWGLGRSARRDADKRGLPRPSQAQPGEVLGILGTVLSCVVLAGCAAIAL